MPLDTDSPIGALEHERLCYAISGACNDFQSLAKPINCLMVITGASEQIATDPKLRPVALELDFVNKMAMNGLNVVLEGATSSDIDYMHSAAHGEKGKVPL